jgi:hypothetical protein
VQQDRDPCQPGSERQEAEEPACERLGVVRASYEEDSSDKSEGRFVACFDPGAVRRGRGEGEAHCGQDGGRGGERTEQGTGRQQQRSAV